MYDYESGRPLRVVSKRVPLSTKILSLLMVVMAIFGAGFFGGLDFLRPDVANNPVASDAFDVQIVRTFKIASVAYTYSDVIYDPDTVKLPVVNKNLPFSESHLGIEYKGRMQLGVDASKAKVYQNGNKVVIELPKAEILSHEVVGTPKILFNISGLFNSNTPEEVLPLVFEVGKPKMEQSVQGSAFMQIAEENAAYQLKNFITQLPGMDEFEIEVVTA